MPSKESRKEAIKAFKERKPFLGIFAIRCAPTGQVWVGASRNLYAVQNSSWFSLRNGSHPQKTLQQEWNTHGEPAFQLEVLEQLAGDVPALSVPDVLKEKRDRWLAKLDAHPLP